MWMVTEETTFTVTAVSMETDVNSVVRCAQKERHLSACSPVYTSIISDISDMILKDRYRSIKHGRSEINRVSDRVRLFQSRTRVN